MVIQDSHIVMDLIIVMAHHTVVFLLPMDFTAYTANANHFKCQYI